MPTKMNITMAYSIWLLKTNYRQMKKTYLIIIFLLFCSQIGFSQVFWSEDFSNGIPADWKNEGKSNYNFSVAAVWEYRADTNVSFNGKKGSRGAFSYGDNQINSPTKGNGYVIFDSDYLDNGGSPTGLGTGPAPTPHLGGLITSSINCSGHPNIQLEFTEYFRNFSTIASVFISNNGGSTWVEYPISVNNNLSVNAATLKNQKVVLDISATAGNQSAVLIKFFFNGEMQLPGADVGTGYYFWQIDDISLKDVPDNDIEVLNDSTDFSGKLGFYTKTPKNHAGDTSKFRIRAFNFGVNTQTNVYTNTIIKNKLGVIIYDQNSDTLSSFTSKMTEDFWSKPFIRPNTPEEYSYTTIVKADQTDEYTLNNKPVSGSFEITKNEFARDKGVSSYLYTTQTFQTFGSSKAGFKIATRFEASAADTITSISARIAGNATKSSVFKYQILNSTGDSILMETADHTFSASDSSNGDRWVKLSLPGTGLKLEKDSVYLLAFYAYDQNPALDQVVGVYDDLTILQPGNAALIYLVDLNKWFTNPNAPLIRAYFNEQTSPVPYYTITASTNSTAGQGYISPSGSVSVLENSDKTFRIIPNIAGGYVIDSLIVDGNYIGKLTTYTFDDVTSNHTIRAVFKVAPIYTIDASSGSNGNISPSGQIAVSEGNDKTFTISANPGYEIDSLIVNGNYVGKSSSYTFSSVNANHSIRAVFKKIMVGIKQIALSDIKIYPNPAIDVINIETLANDNIISVKLINIIGEVLSEGKVQPENESKIRMNLVDIKNGIYFIEINSVEGTLKKRLIIQK